MDRDSAIASREAMLHGLPPRTPTHPQAGATTASAAGHDVRDEQGISSVAEWRRGVVSDTSC